MFERRTLPSLLVVALLAAVSVTLGGDAALDLPSRYNPGLDGAPVVVENTVTGAASAAWSYREHGEYDIAVATRDASGTWSDPVFLGRNDGLDQVSPALAADANGTLYLAFAVREKGQVLLSVLPVGAAAWTAPSVVSGTGERASTPALAVVSDRLVLAYRNLGGGIAIRNLPLFVPRVGTNGINDGPDGIDPLGAGSTGTTPSPGGGWHQGPGGSAPKK